MWIHPAVHEISANKTFIVTDSLISQLFVVAFIHPTYVQIALIIVATTCQNSTHSLLTSAKLSIGYLVVGITRELDKKPLLYYPLYIYMAPGPCFNNIYLALKSMLLPHVLLLIYHVFSLRPPCFLHVPWRHTLNLHCTCVYHVYTMKNSCLLTSSLTLTLLWTFSDPSRLLVLPDCSRLCYITSRSRAYLLSLFPCRLIIIILNPNPSPSLSTLSSITLIWGFPAQLSLWKLLYWL